MITLFYTLDDNNEPVACPADDNMLGYSHYKRWVTSRGKDLSISMPLAYDSFLTGASVSTVFVGISAKTPPQLFETLVTYSDGKTVRHSFCQCHEALDFHAITVERFRGD